MQIQENKNLIDLNTFHIDATAKYFVEVNSVEDILNLIELPVFKENERLIIGGGSNLLFTTNVFNGIVIKNNIKGKEVVAGSPEYNTIKIGSGEVWHEMVMWCVENGYNGLENLSLIPGCVGASPMQNIGAYGVEIKDFFYKLEAIELSTGKLHTFDKEACEFGYRESVFKNKLKNKFIITAVYFNTPTKANFNTSYGAIEKELEVMGVKQLSIKAISDAVIAIRSSKLPNPKEIGNAGSFFKNPEVSAEKRNQLKTEFDNLVSYELENGNYKLAAGWLIEQCGWKGKRFGDAGVHVNQALVLVNYDKARGEEIYNLSTQIIESVKQKFGVSLEREVNMI